MRTLKIMQDTQYATSKMVTNLYQYKYGEEMQQIDISNEVCKDFFQGKFDPNQSKYQPKKKKI